MGDGADARYAENDPGGGETSENLAGDDRISRMEGKLCSSDQHAQLVESTVCKRNHASRGYNRVH